MDLVIPEGTEAIKAGEYAKQDITSVVLPESLTRMAMWKKRIYFFE
jgi:hypothetical protein